MDEWPDNKPVSFLGRKLPDHVACRQTVIGEDRQLSYDPGEWTDALVVVEFGELELESLEGERYRFATGAVLFLQSLPVRTLRSRGSEAVVLSAVRGRRA